MDKRKIIAWFIGCMLCYFLIRWVRPHLSVNWVFLKSYATDLLFVPTMCLFALFFIRLLRRDYSIIPAWMILVQTAFVTFYFEYYLPLNCSQAPCYVSDPIDGVFYLLGGILFYFFQRIYFNVPSISAD